MTTLIMAAPMLVVADLEALYGPTFALFLKAPASVFLADGSAVTVYRPIRLVGGLRTQGGSLTSA